MYVFFNLALHEKAVKSSVTVLYNTVQCFTIKFKISSPYSYLKQHAYNNTAPYIFVQLGCFQSSENRHVRCHLTSTHDKLWLACHNFFFTVYNMLILIIRSTEYSSAHNCERHEVKEEWWWCFCSCYELEVWNRGMFCGGNNTDTSKRQQHRCLLDVSLRDDRV